MKPIPEFTVCVLLSSAISFTSCKKADPVSPTTTVPSQNLSNPPRVVADAGFDHTIVLPDSPATLPDDFIRLDGRKSEDPSGVLLSSYFWRQIAGPNESSIKFDTSQITPINNLIEGKYSFELTVTGKSGGAGRDTVVMNVIRDGLTGKEVIFSDLTWILNSGVDLNTGISGDEIGFYLDSPDFYTTDRLMKISLKLDTSSVWIDVPIYYNWYFYLPLPEYDAYLGTFSLGSPARLWIDNMPPLNYQLVGTKVSVKVKFL